MKVENEINNNVNLEKNKNNFFNNIIGKTINNAIDVGLRVILPDLIENQIIDIKNALIENGLKAGIDTAIDSGINLWKSTKGIFTGNFENMKQLRLAIGEGGIIDGMSEVLDNVIDKTYEKGYINKTVNSLIRKRKKCIIR